MLRSREAWTFASSHSFSTPPSKAAFLKEEFLKEESLEEEFLEEEFLAAFFAPPSAPLPASASSSMAFQKRPACFLSAFSAEPRRLLMTRPLREPVGAPLDVGFVPPV